MGRDVGHLTRFDVVLRILADLGTPIRPDMKVMDFGCGAGAVVKTALARGFDAYGCDVYDERYADDPHCDPTAQSPSDSGLASLKEQGRVRQIGIRPYRLPFEDASIDVVISDQVFEHIQDYAPVITELRRILRPGGCFLHIFPSRYRAIEGHVNVPLATFFRPRWWLWLWAAVGVRNPFQHGLPAGEVAKRNAEYLARGTNYLTPAQIRREFARCFGRVSFVERTALRYSGRARTLLKVPFGAAAYGLFYSRLVYGVRSASPV